MQHESTLHGIKSQSTQVAIFGFTPSLSDHAPTQVEHARFSNALVDNLAYSVGTQECVSQPVRSSESLISLADERALAAIEHCVDPDLFKQGPLPLWEISARAAFYEQPLRVQIITAKTAEVWWAESASTTSITAKRMAPGEGNSEDTTIIQIQSPIKRGGYNPASGTYQVCLVNNHEKLVLVDYDFHLSDQTHRQNHPIDFSDFHKSLSKKRHRVVNWAEWRDMNYATRRLVGRKSTASMSFERNLAKLKHTLFNVLTQNGDLAIPHLTFSSSGALYKFIEHTVLRARQHDIPPSQVERLAELRFVWGKLQRTAAQLLTQPEGSCYRGADIDHPDLTTQQWHSQWRLAMSNPSQVTDIQGAVTRINQLLQLLMDGNKTITITGDGSTYYIHGAQIQKAQTICLSCGPRKTHSIGIGPFGVLINHAGALGLLNGIQAAKMVHHGCDLHGAPYTIRISPFRP